MFLIKLKCGVGGLVGHWGIGLNSMVRDTSFLLGLSLLVSVLLSLLSGAWLS